MQFADAFSCSFPVSVYSRTLKAPRHYNIWFRWQWLNIARKKVILLLSVAIKTSNSKMFKTEFNVFISKRIHWHQAKFTPSTRLVDLVIRVSTIHQHIHHTGWNWNGNFSREKKSIGIVRTVIVPALKSRNTTKPTKWHMRPAKTQISLGIRPVWSASSVSAWRKLGSLATHWAHSEDSVSLGGCTGWSESSLGAQSFCWFCHEAAHIQQSVSVLTDLWLLLLLLLCWCFTALRQFSGHFGRGQLTCPHCSWASLVGSLPVLNAHFFTSNALLESTEGREWPYKLSCVPTSKVSVPHFARLAVFVDRFLWD